MITSLFVAIFLPMFLTLMQSRVAQEKARARRMAEHRLTPRLLRFNI